MISEILGVLPWTIELTVISLALGALVGIPLGVIAAVHRNRALDYITKHSGVWICRRIDIARHWITTHPHPSSR